VKAKKIDHIISDLMENLIKYRPNYVATFLADHIFRNYSDEIKMIWSSKVMQDLSNQ
jgi:hypothetical protein